MPSATDPPSPSLPNTSHPDLPPFPVASTFSLLPDLYLLISRLTRLQDRNSSATAIDSTSVNPASFAGPPLEPKDLPAAIYPLKQKIAKAKAAVSALPDVERSIEEQETEIRGLERRIEALQGRKRELGRIAAMPTRESDGGEAMEGVERGEDVAEAGE